MRKGDAGHLSRPNIGPHRGDSENSADFEHPSTLLRGDTFITVTLIPLPSQVEREALEVVKRHGSARRTEVVTLVSEPTSGVTAAGGGEAGLGGSGEVGAKGEGSGLTAHLSPSLMSPNPAVSFPSGALHFRGSCFRPQGP